MALYSTVAFLERTARSTSWAVLLCSAANAAACFAAAAASATLQGCGFGLRTGLGLGETGGKMVPEAGDCWGFDVCGKCHAECRGSVCRIMLLTNQARLPRNCRRFLLLKWVPHCIETSPQNRDRLVPFPAKTREVRPRRMLNANWTGIMRVGCRPNALCSVGHLTKNVFAIV